jgi:hypothetical protein
VRAPLTPFSGQSAVEARRLPFCRIDGSVISAEARQSEVERFQAEGSTIPVFLLTSQVGRGSEGMLQALPGPCFLVAACVKPPGAAPPWAPQLRAHSACLSRRQVGGLGLTLTAADRVVIVDPSWNPAQVRLMH